MKSTNLLTPILILMITSMLVGHTRGHGPHKVIIRSHNLYPESVKWDPSSQHFVVGSLRHPSLHSVSDAGVLHTIVRPDPLRIPANASFGGVSIDTRRRRLFATVHSPHPFPQFNALVAYDLRRPTPHPLLFIAPLAHPDPSTTDRQVANDVALDALGNAYVTNSASNFIWKVDADGSSPSIFSNSPVFHSHPTYSDGPAPHCGLNGIVYHPNGYFLVVQSNTGKMYKVDAGDGIAKLVLLPKDLRYADGMAIRGDGMVVVVSHHTAWFLKSDDGWAEAVIFDEIPLDVGKFASAVAIREGKTPYVLYGHIDEAMLENVDREEFSIEELESEREREGEKVWMFVLIGFGLAYFLYWRFQMGRLVKEMNKKKE